MSNEGKLEVYENSVKLCRAVQKYGCIYDRQNVKYARKETCEAAWIDIAKICDEKVPTCRNRWRNIRTSFMRSLQKVLKKGQNCTAEYYLHGVLRFLIPHVLNKADLEKIQSEGFNIHDDLDETEEHMVSAEPQTIDEVTKEIEKKNLSAAEETEPSFVPVEGSEMQHKESANNLEKQAAAKNTPSRKLNKHNDEPICTASASGHFERKELPHTSSSSKSIENNTDEINDVKNEVESKQQKRISLLKPNLETFYIKQKPAKLGTFIIKKVSDTSDKNDEDNTKNMEEEQDVSGESVVTLTEADKSAKSVRPRRSCKRSLDKTVVKELRLRRKEPETKRRRLSKSEVGDKHNVEKIEATIPATSSTLEEESHGFEQLENIDLNTVQHNKKEVELQEELEVDQDELLSDEMADSQVNALSNSDPLEDEIGLPQFDSTKKTEQQKDILRPISVTHQATQCTFDLKPSSSYKDNDDDFLNTLKPHMAEMNPRQKLHFRKKIYQSLMEVFDDNTNFPNAEVMMVNPHPPELFPTHTTDELHLIRELVSVVQASKGMPEFSNKSKENETNDTKESSNNATIKEAAPSEILPVQKEDSNVAAPAASSSPSNADASTLPCRVIRRIIKLGNNELNSASNMPSTGNRRVYRIYPKGMGSGGIDANYNSGTTAAIVPRGNIVSANRMPTLTSITHATPTQFAVPHTSMATSINTTISSSNINNAHQLLNPSDKRRILRRFSVCNPGALTVRSTPTKFITTNANVPTKNFSTYTSKTLQHSANTLQQSQQQPLYSGKTSTNMSGTFKIPTGFSSNGKMMAAAKATTTNISSSNLPTSITMSMPGLTKYTISSAAVAKSVGTLTTTPSNTLSSHHISSSTPKAIFPPLSSSRPWSSSSTSSASSSPVIMHATSLNQSTDLNATTNVTADKTEKSKSTETAGVIASDDFAYNLSVFPIKSEVIDDQYAE